MGKNAGIYEMCHRSGPVELCEKMLDYIKCATDPDPPVRICGTCDYFEKKL